MTKPLRVAALLPSKMYDIDAITDDPPVIRGILEGYARREAARGAVLPDNWGIEVTANVIITSRFQPDERVLRIEGVVTATSGSRRSATNSA